MPKPLRTFRVTVVHWDAARAADTSPYHGQVEVIGAFPSKAAFARALAAVGFFHNERQALNQINFSGGETWNSHAIELTTAEPGQLFVGPMSGGPGKWIRWPQ